MKNNSGFLILEVLVSIVVLSTVLLSVYSLIRASQTRAIKNDFGNDVIILTQNSLEVAVDNLKNNWADFEFGTYYPAFDAGANTWSLIPLTSSFETNVETRYTRKIEVKTVCRDHAGEISNDTPCPGNIDENSKLVTVDIGWMNKDLGKPLSTSLLVIKTE